MLGPEEHAMSLNYIVDEAGQPTAVVISIEEWRTIETRLQALEPERNDTARILASPAMRQRLDEALADEKRMSWDEVRSALGL